MAEQTASERAGSILAQLEARGATRISPAILQPAEALLDLYGEDIRARAYRTDDPVHGEQMLRPDFTVPVVQAHMASGAGTARYAYAGPVWRRQDYRSTQAREFWQVGYEVFGGEAPWEADADVFATFHGLLKDQGLTAVTGDLALVFAAIRSLETSDRRKAALMRHVWRPARFARLLARFSGEAPFACDGRNRPACDAPHIGLRSLAEIDARWEGLAQERAAADLTYEQLGLITTILDMRGAMSACVTGAQTLARSVPELQPVADAMARRVDGLATKGVDVDALAFEGSFGRGSLEYYDGFTFAFNTADGEAVAQGGRYDALTQVLGRGTGVPAVGGIIRPEGLS